MRTITNVFTVYNIEELSEEARNKAIEDYKNDENVIENNNYFFQEDIKYLLSEEFKRSDLNISYSLGYCQGDGLYIYGNIDFMDGLEKIKDNFSAKELKTLTHYIKNSQGFSKLEEKHRYYYYDADQNAMNIEYDLIDYMKYYLNYRNINEELINKYARLLSEYLQELSWQYEEEGYRYLYYDYEGYESDIIESISVNEYEYYENGDRYY